MARFAGNYNNVNPARKFVPFLAATFLLGMVVGAILGGVGGVFIFIRVTGANDQPSAPISAPTLSLDSLTAAPTVSAIPSLTALTTTNVAPSPTHDMAAMTSGAMPTSASVTPTTQLFRISSSESVARFSVDETIPSGTAVGTTNQIAGDVIIDFANPENSQLGVIRINLRTLRTDDPDRDNSIRCCVLLTAQDAFEFTDFVPTAFSGLPSQPITLGQTVNFQVTGNFSLRGNTRPVTFAVEVTVESAETIRGTARSIVNRSDFGILDDDMLAYHGVAEQVRLEFDFVARAVPA